MYLSPNDPKYQTRPHVVILGGGFVGISAAKQLQHAPVDITLIDRRNHHLFQPLLYQVATAGLSAPDIAQPLRHIFANQSNVTTLMDEVTSIDLTARKVTMKEHTVSFDYLILGLGAQTGFFGNNHWEQHTLGLKTLNEATDIRRSFLTAFEMAEVESDPVLREKLLTFVVVGGGPTGVEMAGAMAELAGRVLTKDFRRIDPSSAKIHLVEAGPRLLPMFSEKQSEYTQRRLEKMGVIVHLHTPVTHIEEGKVIGSKLELQTDSIVWAAGVEANRVSRHMGEIPLDRGGRIQVEKDLRVPNFPNVFAAGDIVSLVDVKGVKVPGVAPSAMQMGRHAARQIIRDLEQKETEPFVYFDKGNMATIGRSSAVAAFAGLRFNGFSAWFAWLAVHLIFLMGMRNRVMVFLNWTWSYLSWHRGARIITGQGYIRTPRNSEVKASQNTACQTLPDT